MATVWGNISNHWRIGIDVVVSGTTATMIVYGQSQAYGHNFSSSSVTLGGSWSGSVPYTFYSANGATVTKELYRASQTFTGTRTFTASTTYWGGGSSSVSRSVTIANASTPSWSGNFVTGTAKTITLQSGYTHDVTYSYTAANGSNQTGTIATGAGASTSWNPAHTLFNVLPSASSVPVSITVVTKSGSTTIGTRSASGTLELASGQIPTSTSVSWSDNNTTVASNFGNLFIQNRSLVKGVINGAAGVNGSTISSKKLVVGGVDRAENTQFSVPSSGTYTASGVYTDSRGRTGTRAANFSVGAYGGTPTVNSVDVFRANNTSGTADNNGTYLRVTLSGTIGDINFGGFRNGYIISVRTRPQGGSWTNRNTITGTRGTNSYSSGFTVTGNNIYNTTTAWEVHVKFADLTGAEVNVYRTVSVGGLPYVHFHSNGNTAIGKYWERGGLDVQGAGYFTSEVYAAGIAADNRLVRYGEARNASTLFNTGTVPAARLPTESNPPIGGIMDWAGSSAPSGWLLCQGQAVSRTTYAALFAVLGTTYGVGNGSTTFNLPDLRGKTTVGLSTSDTEFNALGKTFGTKTHTLTTAEMPSHNHPAYYINLNVNSSSGTSRWIVGTPSNFSGSTLTGSRGDSGAHNNIQPSFTLNKIIRAT